MASFFEYMKAISEHSAETKSAVAQDAQPKRRKVRYIIDCSDQDKQLLNLLECIRATAKYGHSFSVVVDPDAKGAKSFFIDGDGSDHIGTILECSKDDDIIGLLLANLDIMRMICRDATPDEETKTIAKDPSVAIKEIHTTLDTLLSGNLREHLEPIQRFVENVRNSAQRSDSNPNWTINDAIEHIVWLCDNYEKELKSITKAAAPKNS